MFSSFLKYLLIKPINLMIMSIKTVPSIVPAVKSYLLVLLISLFMIPSAFGQLNGTYTIGKDGDFITFTEAATELNKVGVSGLVTFMVKSGTYNEQFTLGAIENTVFKHWIVFRSETGNPEDVILRFAAATKESNFIVRLQGSQHIEFRDLSFEATGLGRAFQLEAATGNIAITGCKLTGIYITNAATDPALIFSLDPNLENLNITDNVFSSCSFGIYLQGLYNNHIHGLHILDNTFVNSGYNSIFLNRVHHPEISGNLIQGGYLGINVTSGEAGISMVKNNVSVSGHGIKINYTGNLEPGLIANNFILVDGVSESYGLDIQNSSWLNVYHNTVVINTHNSAAHAFNCNSNTAGTIRVINNSFSCMHEGYASYVQYPVTLLQSDYNNYYSASSMMFYRGQKAYDLTDLKNPGTHDQHSISVWPGHLSDTDLHAYTRWLAGKGSPLPEVTDDIDGDPRDAERPDIGADEFSTGTMFLPSLSGDYIIGPGKDFETLQSIIDIMKVRGISGSVWLRLTTGIHDEQAELVSIPGSSPENWIHITRPELIPVTDSVVLRHNATGVDDNYILRLNGADFCSIHGITFRAENDTYSRIIEINGGADSVNISYNVFRSTSNTSNVDRKTAIISNNSYYVSREIENNIFHGGAYGIIMRRAAYNYDYPKGALIRGNTLNVGYTGIYIQFHDAPKILSNTITAGSQGMLLSQLSGPFRIEKNKLNIHSQYGIRLSASQSNQVSPGLIANNFIHVGGTGNAYGLYIASTNFLNIFYNSINVTSSNATNGRSLYCTSGSQIMLKNNIFANTGGGYAYYVTTTSAISGSDYNNIYTSGTNLAWFNDLKTNLAELQTGNSYHQHCISVNPNFTNYSDLHASNEAMKGAATPLLSISDDIDGDLRHLSTPDIGADEFSGGGSVLFTEMPLGLPGISNGNAAWIDYDYDGKLDILLSGKYLTTIYENSETTFFEADVSLMWVDQANVALTDFNNDGFIDIYLTGRAMSGEKGILYENEHGSFNAQGTPFRDLWKAKAEWADFDKDGDEDLLVTGITPEGSGFTGIYWNNKFEGFEEQDLGINVTYGNVAVADYDGDGDFDFVICGLLENARFTTLYENTNGNFTETNDLLTGVNSAALEWGDVDNDGDLDLLISGYDGVSGYITKIYKNEEGRMEDSEIQLPGFVNADAQWADYDNDGDLDFIICGYTNSGNKTSIFNNEGGTFTEIDAKLPGVQFGSVAWGDYDKDGDLDILLCGNTDDGDITKLYVNNTTDAGDPPLGPSNLSVRVADKYAILSWDPGSDNQTPVRCLNYNLYVGQNVMPSMAHPDGTRQVVDRGNAEGSTSWLIKDLTPGAVYNWKIQSIDQSYRTSAFADGGSFTTLDGMFSAVHDISTKISDGDLDFGDYDNDGDLDFIVCGKRDGRNITEIYTNNNGSFTKLDIDLPGVSSSDVEWGDYDNDGFLDFVLCGEMDQWDGYLFHDEYTRGTFIFHNNAGTSFTSVGTTISNVRKGAATWGDCDNDGDLDLLISGVSYNYNAPAVEKEGGITKIYLNEGMHNFTDLDIELMGYKYADADWGDYDGDGDLDFIVCGANDKIINGPIDWQDTQPARIYRNDGNNNFTLLELELPAVKDGAVAWGDYDNDGDLDFALTGRPADRTYIYKNVGGGMFIDIEADIPPVYYSSVEWGDMDNDGLLDLILSGIQIAGNLVNPINQSITAVFRNDGNGQFIDMNSNLPPVQRGCLRAADWTGDGALDLILMGDGFNHLRTYQNNSLLKNTSPTVPEHLMVTIDAEDLVLQWNHSYDDETSRRGLSYNLKIGSTSGGENMKSPMSNSNGIRKIVRSGNAGQVNNYGIKLTNFVKEDMKNDLYWSVQAVDNGYSGSPFAPVDTVDLSGAIFSTADVPHDQGGKVTVRWRASDLDHNIDFLQYYSIWRAIPLGKKSTVSLSDPANLSMQNTSPFFRKALKNGTSYAWEWVANQPAHKLPVYAYTCPTVNDSMQGYSGLHTFMVSAHTSNPNIYFDSDPVTGYSVDNLAPAPPQNTTAEKKSAGILVSWSANSEPDLKEYLLFRSQSPGINPETLTPYAIVRGTSFLDENLSGDHPEFYYVVCASDIHGNISEPGSEVMAFITGISNREAIPKSFSLHPLHPNPMNDHTLIRFDLPDQSDVTIEVFTMQGEKLTTLIQENLPAGCYTYHWEPGGSLPSSAYLCVFRAGEFRQVRKILIINSKRQY
jgi:hypothetical protein